MIYSYLSLPHPIPIHIPIPIPNPNPNPYPNPYPYSTLSLTLTLTLTLTLKLTLTLTLFTPILTLTLPLTLPLHLPLPLPHTSSPFIGEGDLQGVFEKLKVIGEEMEGNANDIWGQSAVIKRSKASTLVIVEPAHNLRVEHFNWNLHRWVVREDISFMTYMYKFCGMAQNLAWLFYPCCTQSRRQSVEAITQGCYFASQSFQRYKDISLLLFEDTYRMLNYCVRYVRTCKEEPRGTYYENRYRHYAFSLF
jgi:hypothetical protein